MEENYTALPKKRKTSCLTKFERYVAFIPSSVKSKKINKKGGGSKKQTLKFFFPGLIFGKIIIHHVN